MKKRIALAVIGIVCVTAALAIWHMLQQKRQDFEDNTNAQNVKELRVAVQEYFISMPVYYILQNKMDEQFGIKIIPVQYQTGAEQSFDIEKDVYDVAMMGGALLQPMIKNQGILIAEHIKATDGDRIYVRKDSPILDMQGFNPTYPDIYGDRESVIGKKIIMKSDTTQQYLGVKWLESVGVRKEDVTIQYREFRDAYEEFLSGEGDIVVLSAPYSYMAESAGLKKIADVESLNMEYYEVIIATKKAYREKKEELTAFLQCLLYANSILEGDYSKKVKATQEWYKACNVEVTKDLIKEECKDKILVTVDNYDEDQFGTFEVKYAEYMAHVGNISPLVIPNIEKNMDKSLFETAVEREKAQLGN